MNFKDHKDGIEKAGYLVHDDQVVGPRGDVVALIDKFGDVHSKDEAFLDLLVELVSKPEPKKVKAPAKEKVAKRKTKRKEK